jgi:hypothetical protein
MLTSFEMDIVVVVPGRNGIDDLFTLVNDSAIKGIYDGSAP